MTNFLNKLLAEIEAKKPATLKIVNDTKTQGLGILSRVFNAYTDIIPNDKKTKWMAELKTIISHLEVEPLEIKTADGKVEIEEDMFQIKKNSKTSKQLLALYETMVKYACSQLLTAADGHLDLELLAILQLKQLPDIKEQDKAKQYFSSIISSCVLNLLFGPVTTDTQIEYQGQIAQEEKSAQRTNNPSMKQKLTAFHYFQKELTTNVDHHTKPIISAWTAEQNKLFVALYNLLIGHKNELSNDLKNESDPDNQTLLRKRLGCVEAAMGLMNQYNNQEINAADLIKNITEIQQNEATMGNLKRFYGTISSPSRANRLLTNIQTQLNTAFQNTTQPKCAPVTAELKSPLARMHKN